MEQTWSGKARYALLLRRDLREQGHHHARRLPVVRGERLTPELGDARAHTKDGMSRDLLSSSAEDPRRCLTVELEEAPSDDRNGT